jgi:hypothetical protein
VEKVYSFIESDDKEEYLDEFCTVESGKYCG